MSLFDIVVWFCLLGLWFAGGYVVGWLCWLLLCWIVVVLFGTFSVLIVLTIYV